MSNELPGWNSVAESYVWRELETAGRRGLTAGQLLRRLGERLVEAETLAALQVLQTRGRAVEWNRRFYAIGFTDWRAGIVESLAEGDALVQLEGEEAGHLFVGRRHLKNALDGDLVLVKELRRGRRRWRQASEAAVVRVLCRRYDTVVGTLELDERGQRWLVPFDPKMTLEVEVEGGEALLEDQYAVVELQTVASGGGRARGRVLEVLGSVEHPGVDVQVVLRHYKIREAFPQAVRDAAAALPADPRPEDLRGRQDLRQQTVVTIDGESARDFDDAISVSPLEGRDGYRLGVHIADVAHYVREGSELDAEAYRRGTSVYYPERAVPMLPEELSNGLCSLRPGVPRLALSVFLDISSTGRILGRRFAETVICSARRLTYRQVRRLLEEPRAEDVDDYGHLLPSLQQMRQLMQVLNGVRRGRGSLDFDLPEGDVILDTDGYMVGVRPEERNVAHRIIEEFMIAANEAVASELVTRGCPALFRIHEPPSRERLEELQQVLASLGVRLQGDLDHLPASALQEALRQVEHTGGALVSALVLRSLKRALYHPECQGHYALASDFYTHFTSPIRRYPDLLVHRRLKALLQGRAEREAAESHLLERLPSMADHTSWTERRAEQSERELLQWKKVRFLAGRIGERFPGRITGVQPFGLFVQLEDLYVDGLVPVRTLTDDYYLFQPEEHRLVGERQGRIFRLADAVEVLLVGVNERQRGLELKIMGMLEPIPTAKSRKGKRGRKGQRRRRS